MEAPTGLVMSLLWLLGGLALFLYGIEIMGDALRRAAGPFLRSLLDRFTSTRFRSLVLGIVVTVLVQSSSASTVMVVGFINAGLITFERSVSLILGANLGTTVTPLITALDLTTAALPLLGIGFIVYVFSPRRGWQQVGLAIMGFGMLFFGLMLMKLAVSGYKTDIQEWLKALSGSGMQGYTIAFLVTAGATAIIQSSAATIVMIQAMAFGGALEQIDTAIPMILGAQVGTCITAMIASMRGSLSAKRSALAHLAFNLVGALIATALFPLLVKVLPMTAETLPVQIANAHLLTRIVSVALFYPFTVYFGKLIKAVVRGEDLLNAAPVHLDYSAMDDAEKALNGVILEVRRLFETCMDLLNAAIDAFLEDDDKAARLVVKREDLVDDLQRTISDYLVRVSRKDIPESLALRPSLLLHILSDVERIGDHAQNIVELSAMHRGSKIHFSTHAVTELQNLQTLVNNLAEGVRKTMETQHEDDMVHVLRTKQEINDTVDTMLDNHAARLTDGTCYPIGGMIFVELVTNLRRVANHQRNIAASITSRMPEPTAQIHALKEEIGNDKPKQ